MGDRMENRLSRRIFSKTMALGLGAGSAAASPASAHNPQVAVDAAGDVFISDYGNSRVVEVPYLGNGLYGPQTTVGNGLYAPYGVAVDAAGDLFVTDTGHGRVVEVPARWRYPDHGGQRTE